MSEYPPYEGVRLEPSTPVRDISVWFVASLCLSLIPFLFTAVAYRAREAHKPYHLPSLAMLFGDGELLLVVISVIGATLTELVLTPGHLDRDSKRLAFAATLGVAFGAVGLFTAVTCEHLTHPENIDSRFIADLSIVMLSVVILVQIVTVLTRPSKA